MKKNLFFLMCLGALSACQSPNGVFKGLNKASPSNLTQKTLADDTGRELNFLFHPAKDKILIEQDADRDFFGKTLVSNLRSRGFSVEEQNEEDSFFHKKQKNRKVNVSLAFNYVLDGIGQEHWRVLILTPEGVKYSREYSASANTALAPTPLGSWVKLSGETP